METAKIKEEKEMSTLDEQQDVLARVAEQIKKRGLVTPALFALESSRPFSFIASQALVVFGPLIQAILSITDFEIFCDALENRANLDWLIERLETDDDL